jgi:hypothetical protein
VSAQTLTEVSGNAPGDMKHAALPVTLWLEVSLIEGAEHVKDQRSQQSERQDSARMVLIRMV